MSEPAPTEDERPRPRIGSPSLPGAIVSAWLATAIATAATAATFQRWFPGYGAIVLAGALLIIGALTGARAASQREGAWGALIASVAFAGTLPAFISVSLFAATRPLMACRGVVGVDCHPTHATFFYLGAATTIVPLVLSSIVAVMVERRRSARLARVLAGLAVAGWFVAMIVAGGGALRASYQVSADRYLDTLTELGPVIVALAGVLGSLALVLVRLSTERRLLARWRAELIGAKHGEDYRSPERAADQVTDGVLARVVQDGRERRAATFVLAGLVAVIAATPLAAALFVIGR